ncbi:hypothetical protein LguiB_003516 [Lonicera macranthoides]
MNFVVLWASPSNGPKTTSKSWHVQNMDHESPPLALASQRASFTSAATMVKAIRVHEHGGPEGLGWVYDAATLSFSSCAALLFVDRFAQRCGARPREMKLCSEGVGVTQILSISYISVFKCVRMTTSNFGWIE